MPDTHTSQSSTPAEDPTSAGQKIVTKRAGLEVASQTISYTLIALTIPLFIVYLAYSSFSWSFDIGKAQESIQIYKKNFDKLVKYDSGASLYYLEFQKMDKAQDSMDVFFRNAGLSSIHFSNLEDKKANISQNNVPASLKRVYLLPTEDIELTNLDSVAEYSSLNRNKVTNFCGERIKGYWDYGFDNYLIRGSFGTSTSTNLGISTIIALVLAIVAMGLNQYYKFKRQKETQAFQNALRDKVNNETGAAPVWELAQVVLSRYYDRNLNQNRMIFYVSVAVMVAGFGLILYGLSLTYKPAGAGLSTTVLSVGSGVIVQFIGATFLVIYNSTISQSAQYTNSLQRVSTIGTSIKLLDNIEASGATDPVTKDLLTNARIDIAKLLIKQAQGAGTTPEDVSEKA